MAEIDSGLNGKRKKRLPVRRDPRVSRIRVEHRDRRAGFGFERVEAALAAAGQRVVVVEEGEIPDDQIWDIPEILVSACGRRGGRRSARNCAKRAPEALACG